MKKYMCPECWWHGTEDEILSAPHPFVKSESVYGCPDCMEVNTLLLACDEPGCWATATCGTPTENGYRNTCGKHRPK